MRVTEDKLLGRRELLKAASLCIGSTLFALGTGAYKFQIGQQIVTQEKKIGEARDGFLMGTPNCDQLAVTPAVSEGPFYAPASPRRIDLRPNGAGGRPLRLAGRVLDLSCKPIVGAVLDFWQTDPNGNYDHYNYNFRGHQFSDAEGRYELLTWLPISYEFMGVSRRRHIHVKVAARNYTLLTSQVFFPLEEDRGIEDFSFNARLVSEFATQESTFIEARFDFVLEKA
jgi:protocatechuate 3,4-dioxygenase beta subunit